MAIKLTKDKSKRETPFSYDNITKRDKQIVEEVINHLKLKGSKSEEYLKEKFEIIPTIEVPYEKCMMYNLCKELGIYMTAQGFVKEGKIKYPVFSITADIRELDRLVMTIAKKYEKSNT